MDTNQIATSSTPEFQTMESAPWGHVCLLLTNGGVMVKGVAEKRTAAGYGAWYAMPKVPPKIKQLLLERQGLGPELPVRISQGADGVAVNEYADGHRVYSFPDGTVARSEKNG